MNWMVWAAVAAGSAIGGVLRFALAQGSQRMFGMAWPWGTFLVNALGCLAIGLVAGWWSSRGQPVLPRAFLMVGILGGFTTYSSFALETVLLWQQGAAARAAGYVVATTLVCVAAAAGGLWLWQQWISGGVAR